MLDRRVFIASLAAACAGLGIGGPADAVARPAGPDRIRVIWDDSDVLADVRKLLKRMRLEDRAVEYDVRELGFDLGVVGSNDWIWLALETTNAPAGRLLRRAFPGHTIITT